MKIRLKELRKLEVEYIDKLYLNSIKLTKLDEVEKTGFGIQDLKSKEDIDRNFTRA